MITENLLLSVAPSTLISYRGARCKGNELALTLQQFPSRDSDTICALYVTLGELASTLRDSDSFPSSARAVFHERIATLIAPPREASSPCDAVAQALHDIRGGTLTALLIGLSEPTLLDGHYGKEAALTSLVRDQRKIIRNTVIDIDADGRARDAVANPHSLSDLSAGVSSFARTRGGEALSIDIHCNRDAMVADSCLEFASLERAVFNLLNNAARHAHEAHLDVWLLVCEENARIAVANPLTSQQAEYLATVLEENPACLYRSFTTTGSGLGLGIVADVVGNAYGLTEPEDLVSGGYVGTRIVDDSFLTWIHWPLSAG